MNSPALKNYEELCRLCASYDAIKIPIFSERGRERNLKDKITTCLPFDVSEDDLLPKSLCYRCIYNLENFYDFRRGCIDARTRLENVIKEVLKLEPKEEGTCVKIEDIKERNVDNGHRIEDDLIESDGEGDCPNPADFLEACLGESPHNLKPGDEEEGSYSCRICDRQFNSKSSLTIHLKFHQDSLGQENDKDNYACYVCEKVFSSKGHLALHSKVHIGETSSPAVSNSSRSSPQHLHKTNIKLYRCDLCNKSYSMAKHLWGHVSTTHKGHPMVTCGLCQRTFSSVSNLEDHKRVKHKDESNAELITDPSATFEEGVPDFLMEKKPEEVSSNRRKNSKPRKIEREVSQNDCHLPTENSESSMKQEFEKTSSEPVYSCLLCHDKFREADHLSQHLSDCHGYDGPLDFSTYRDETGEDYAESMMELETVFCCEICIREFNDRGSLWLHMLYSHRDEASKACGVCLKICDDTESLTQHVESAHPRSKTDQRRYSCQVCARQHDSRKKLVTHAKIHNLVDAEGNLVDPESVVILNSDFYPDGFTGPPLDDSYMHSCEICFKVFENDTKLLKHKRSAHRDSMGSLNSLNSGAYHFYFACEICGLSHLSRSERWRHMASTHAGDLSVTCEVPECGKVFPTSSIKKEHAAHHAAQGQYPNTCEVCGKMWKTRVEYWKHMMGVHPDCLPFICGVCLKVFCNLTNLVGHVREKHWPLLGGDFCCDICGRPYSKVSKMTRHRKVHYVPDNPPELQALLENPKVESEPHFLQQTSTLACDLCDGNTFEYANVEELGKHRQETHNVMPCDLCTKYYGRTSHLWKHVNKIHKGHPDVTCPTCQRTSASKSHLATHIAKHHRSEDLVSSKGEKESNGIHTCEKCSKVFRKETLVRKHVKHCKGPRPTPIPLPAPVDGVYTCERCDKSFSLSNLLYKHMKSSHVTFSCELCETKCNTKTELYQHICAEHADHPDVKCGVTGCDKILRCKADLEKHQKGHRLSFHLHYCIFCAELVTSKYKMRRHLKAIHANESKYLCAICLKALPGYKELQAHVQATHQAALQRAFACHVCGKPCTNKSKLMEHIKYHGSNFLPCKICLKIFSSKEELDTHIDNHPSDSGDEEDQVEDVELDTNSIMDIIGAPKNDVNLKTEEKETEKRKAKSESENSKPKKKTKLEILCTICSDIFTSNLDLKKHMREAHTNNKPDETSENSGVSENNAPGLTNSENKTEWETSNSDKSFMHQLGLMPETEKAKLKTVRKVYTDDFTPSECELCGKVWPAKRHLWQHLIRFHKLEAGRTCGVCLKLCPDFPCLSAHLAIEHPNNFDGEATNVSCRVCGKYHGARSKLLSHASIHVGHEERAIDDVHHCLICKDTFVEFTQFCDHIRKDHKIDEGEGKYSLNGPETCVDNNDVESNSVNGSEHSKLPFHSCEICSLVFASEIGLTNHRRIHEHSDHFKCGQCGEVFASAENLCTHKLQKHKGTEFVCADCKSNFSTYNQLTEHNKQCKMKLKNMGDANSDDDDLLLDDDIEELETSYGANDTHMSSESDIDKSEILDETDDKSEVLNDNDIESEEPTSEEEEEKSNTSETSSHKEPKAVEAFLGGTNVEVVQIDLSDDNSNSKANEN